MHEPSTRQRGSGQWIPNWRVRVAAALVTLAVVLAMPLPVPWNSRVVFAYTAGISVLCALTYRVIAYPRREEMTEFVRQQGSPTWAPLVGAGTLSLVSLGALIYLLRTVNHAPAEVKGVHVVASLVAVLVTWVCLHTIFAVRYAALYYAPAADRPDHPAGGLSFPDPELVPDYWDFLYYSFVIGMCYQTSDVSVVRADLRRYTLLHSVFAYLYGVGILSLLISTVGGTF